MARARPFRPFMRISGYASTGASYAASASTKAPAQPVRNDKLELSPSDGFASSQLPPGVGENVNIKA
jgi:hypothetical protein